MSGEKVVRGQIREVKVDFGEFDKVPMSRVIGDMSSSGYHKLSPAGSNASSIHQYSSYRKHTADQTKSRPLLFTIFGWCFSILATFLILFVLFLMAFLLYETLVRENMRISKMNKKMMSTPIMSTTTTENPVFGVD